MNGGSLNVTRSTVADNYFAGMGGGISAQNLESADIRDSTISGNVADTIGGGANLAWVAAPSILPTTP
jgi:hypothetical protein